MDTSDKVKAMADRVIAEMDRGLVPVVPVDPRMVTDDQRSLAGRGASDGADVALRSLQSLMPDSIGSLVQMARVFSQSKVVPKSLRGKPDDCLVVLMAGLEMKLTPIRAMQNIMVISGNLAVKADMQLAQVRSARVLQFFDEGFELKGTTDTDLADRLPDPMLARKIAAATKDLPGGKPYGWAAAQRTGETQLHVRVFSWADADRAQTNQWEGDGEERTKKQIKLHEKDTYKNYPQDTYPRRARCRVLALLFSDVLAGIPAVETIDADVIEGEVIQADTAGQLPGQRHDDVEQLLAKIQDDEMRGRVLSAFEKMGINRAKQLLLLKEHWQNPDAILDELLAEHDKRTGKLGPEDTPRKATRAKKAAAVPDKPKAAATDKQAAADAPGQQQVVDVKATEEPAAAKATPKKKRTF